MPKILTILFSLLLIAAPAFSSADQPLGRKLELSKKPNGKPVVGVQFTTTAPQIVAITFSVKGSQLVGNVAAPTSPSFWALVNKETMSQLTDWQATGIGTSYIDPNSNVALTVSVSNQNQASSVVKTLAKSVLVLSLNTVNAPVPTVYLDLSELCALNPDQILNLDTFETGCE